MGSSHKLRFSLWSLAAVAVAAPQATSATVTQTIGGPGGQSFRLECGAGARLAGFRAQAGSWVDGLGLLCTRPGERTMEPVGWVGGQGGSVQEVYCSPGSAGLGLRFTFTNGRGLEREYVNAIALSCEKGNSGAVCVDTGEGCSTFFDRDAPFSIGINATDLRFPDSISCPVGEVLVGIVGRAGNFLNAVGAICGAGETATAATPEVIRLDRPSNLSLPRNSLGSGSSSNFPSSSSIGRQASRPSAAAMAAQGSCLSGFVWREAGPGDDVCVEPAARDRARTENDLADARRDPGSAYGPMGCRSGFVWREAFPSDLACVTPDARSAASQENSLAGARRNQ